MQWQDSQSPGNAPTPFYTPAPACELHHSRSALSASSHPHQLQIHQQVRSKPPACCTDTICDQDHGAIKRQTLPNAKARVVDVIVTVFSSGPQVHLLHDLQE